jgi:hypothetical protein
MIKKLAIITCIAIFLNIACQKDCTNYNYYKIPKIDISVNSNNVGIFTTAIRNSGDTIRSISNQFLFTPTKEFFSQSKKGVDFQLFPTAYAADCPNIEESSTSFSPTIAKFWMNVPFPAATYGIAPFTDIPAYTNLLTFNEIKNAYFAPFLENKLLFSGYDTPFTINTPFFKHFRSQKIKFFVELSTTEGLTRTDSVEAFIDVNI